MNVTQPVQKSIILQLTNTNFIVSYHVAKNRMLALSENEPAFKCIYLLLQNIILKNYFA